MKIVKDNIFLEKKTALISSICYLKAIKQLLPKELALQVSNLAASNYMISYYEKVLTGSIPESKERFDLFRKHYEAYPSISPYCEIVSSDENCLVVKFTRCPYAEVLFDEHLSEFTHSSCFSDISFTKQLLPGVEFIRSRSILNGDGECIMTWRRLAK